MAGELWHNDRHFTPSGTNFRRLLFRHYQNFGYLRDYEHRLAPICLPHAIRISVHTAHFACGLVVFPTVSATTLIYEHRAGFEPASGILEVFVSRPTVVTRLFSSTHAVLHENHPLVSFGSSASRFLGL